MPLDDLLPVEILVWGFILGAVDRELRPICCCVPGEGCRGSIGAAQEPARENNTGAPGDVCSGVQEAVLRRQDQRNENATQYVGGSQGAETYGHHGVGTTDHYPSKASSLGQN